MVEIYSAAVIVFSRLFRSACSFSVQSMGRLPRGNLSGVPKQNNKPGRIAYEK
jgi:hypothetical protein